MRWAVAAGRLPVTLVRVAAGGRAVSGGRALLIGLRRIALVRVATLVGVAALVGVALARRIGRLTLGRVAALVLRGVLAAGILATIVLLVAVPLVVVLIGGPPLSLAAAVARVVSHRYSWFCVGREFSRWGGLASGRIGVDRTARAKLSGVQVR